MTRSVRRTVVNFAWLIAGTVAQAQMTERVSVSSAGTQGDEPLYMNGRISADGRFVAFGSASSNLVVGDANQTADVFVHDRQLGTTELVSVSSAGLQADSYSSRPSISADGRFVAFQSRAANLVAGDSNGLQDIFVRDRLNGTTVRVSVASGGAEADHDCEEPAISADGRFVTFQSRATTLVAGVPNVSVEIFVRDQFLQTTSCVSRNSGGTLGNQGSFSPSISTDGRFVAFYSEATNLVTGDTNGLPDVFLRDQLLGTIELVSLGLGGAGADGPSAYSSISIDGRYVAFDSDATNLVTGDTNGQRDVFVRDRQSGATTRASLFAGGVEGHGLTPSISSDGRFVAFVGGLTSAQIWIYVRDLQAGATEIASISSGGLVAGGPCSWPSLSADGRYVEFSSSAANLVAGDTNGWDDIFVRDRGGPLPSAFCFGDGSSGACPCGNNGLPGAGCENSAGTGGAVLTAVGGRSLSTDTLVFSSSGELFSVLTIFLQGSVSMAPANFGDGLRCVGGSLKRMYAVGALGGVATAPGPGDLTVSARSAALGDLITSGETRYYQAYYRDPPPLFCASPLGDAWNVSSGLSVTWGQ